MIPAARSPGEAAAAPKNGEQRDVGGDRLWRLGIRPQLVAGIADADAEQNPDKDDHRQPLRAHESPSEVDCEDASFSDVRKPSSPCLETGLQSSRVLITSLMTTGEAYMPNVVTITRPNLIALIEKASNKLARGNKTEAVALALRRLLGEDARAGSVFAAHRGSVQIREGVDLIAPALDVQPDAPTGRAIDL